MIDLPASTIVNKKIPIKILKKYLIDSEGNEIFLTNVLKEEVGYHKTESVEEILIIEIKLIKQELPEKLIYNLSLNIPYNILFLINFNNRFNYAITTVGSELKIHYLVWGKNLNINLKSSNLGEIWKSIEENFNIERQNTDIISVGELDLQKELATLEKQFVKETEFLKKVELKAKIIKIKKELNYDK